MRVKRKSFREIARICGVSASTVSRLANGIGSLEGEKADLVLSYLHAEGYEIGGEDDATVMQNVSLIVTDLANEVFNRTAIAMSTYLADLGYTMSIFIDAGNVESRRFSAGAGSMNARLSSAAVGNTNAQLSSAGVGNTNVRLSSAAMGSTEALLSSAAARGDKGVILMGAAKSPVRVECPIPAVNVMTNHEARFRGDSFYVFSDDYVGGQLAARRLLENGRRRPLVLLNRHSAGYLSLRVKGFRDEFEKAGIVIPEGDVFAADPVKSSYESAADAVTYLMTKGASYDCIFAGSDWRAYGAVTALAVMGVRVPEDVMVVGYDGSRIARHSDHPFPTVEQNPERIAGAAVEVLERLIRGEEVLEKVVYVPVGMSRG